MTRSQEARSAAYNKILTITIPAYKVEQYLRQCLDSFLIKELLIDIEVLVIDDGSPDSSAAIAADYQKRFPDTFRLIRKENGGHGSAVNCGIQEATGKYFKVVDGDDWVDQEAFRQLVEFLRHSDCDMVSTEFCWVYDGSDKRSQEFTEPFRGVCYRKTYRFPDICSQLYVKMHAMTIRTAILQEHRIRLDEHCFYVDMEYITYPIPYVDTIAFLKECVYMYRIGLSGQSVNIRSMQRNIEDHLRVVEALLRFYDEQRQRENGRMLAENDSQNQAGMGVDGDAARRTYIARMISRVVAAQFKIELSFGPNNAHKQVLVALDRRLRQNYPEVYRLQRNRVVRLLQHSHFLLYAPVAWGVRRMLIET